MCGPSSGTKAINNQIQQFSSTTTNEAGTIFGAANSVFNSVTSALSGIIKGGPGQNGWSASQASARNAATIQEGATEARNLEGAAGSQVGAIGGGNAVTPAGAEQAIEMGAKEQAASDTASGLNQNQIANAQAGQQEFNTAVQEEENATQAFNPATAANQEATSAQSNAFQSQEEIDNQSNWAMNDVMKLGTAAVSSFAGALGKGLL